MMASRRPLRFLAMVLGGWCGGRIWLLWPTITGVPDVMRAIVPPAAALTVQPRPRAVQALPSRVLVRQSLPPSPRAMHTVATDPPAPARIPPPVALALAAQVPTVPPTPEQKPPPISALASSPLVPPSASRLSASAWLIARPSGRALPFAGQLGGSQAGVRLLYALGAARRVSLSARFASALGSGEREAALGLDWRPFKAPVHLFAEQRIALGRGRGAPAAGVIAGLDPVPLAGGLRLEGYGQAGAIARGGVEGFADGALRLGRPVARLGRTTLDLGVGAWGAAQRGTARLDVGPAATVALPLGDKPLRLSLEWRQRVAGNARPGSGPALTLGRDF